MEVRIEYLKPFLKNMVNFHFVDMVDIQNISNKINDKTKLIWIETPTNPMMNIIDVKSIVEIAKIQKNKSSCG